MEPYIYILQGVVLGLLVALGYKEYLEWQHRRMVKKAVEKTSGYLKDLTERIRLQVALHEAEAKEDYEEAARIRDLMKKQS